MDKHKVPLFYLYIQKKLRDHSIGGIINRKEAIDFLHEWRIPREIRICIVKELENFNLVEDIGGRMIKIKEPLFCFTKINELYIYVELLSLED